MTTQNDKTHEENLLFLDTDVHSIGVRFIVLPDGINSCFVIKVNNEEVIYEPIDLCQFMLTIYGDRATKSKGDLLVQAILFNELKSFLVLIISRMQRFIEIEQRSHDNILTQYDFGNIYKSIDTLIERSKFHLDAHLLTSQVQTNKNTRETNFTIKAILIVTAVIYLAQLLYSIFGRKKLPANRK